MNCFENVKKNFGFGCMRLPMKDGEVDKAEMCRMVDAFLRADSIILTQRTGTWAERVRSPSGNVLPNAIRVMRLF